MSNADIIESSEDEIWQIIQRMKKAGVPCDTILDLFERTYQVLIIRSQAEKYLAGGIEPHNTLIVY